MAQQGTKPPSAGSKVTDSTAALRVGDAPTRLHEDGSDMQIRRLAEVGAAEITGLDLSQPITPALRERIMAAFLEHHILVFRDQHLSKDQQYAFTLNFGEIEGHVGHNPDGSKYPLVHTVNNLDENGRPSAKPHTTGNYYWHTDKSYHAVPSLLTMLHAVELPPGGGGDTQFANIGAAYAALPEETRREIADLKVEHSWEASRRNTGQKPATEAEKRERPPVVHPLVRTHPDTGAKTLYVGMHTSHVIDMERDAGRALLARLQEHATQDRFVYTHKWKDGDLVLWDNRTLLHRAVANYAMDTHRRILHRTVVKGTAPF